MIRWWIEITVIVYTSAPSLIIYVKGVRQTSIEVVILCKLFLQNREAVMDLLIILALIRSVVTDGITIGLYGHDCKEELPSTREVSIARKLLIRRSSKLPMAEKGRHVKQFAVASCGKIIHLMCIRGGY
jgi:hypothetical protein